MKTFIKFYEETANLQCPPAIQYFTPDEVAETVEGIDDAAYRELWQILANTPKQERKPTGSDVTDIEQGTSEVPPEPDVGLRMKDCWNQLSLPAKQNIINSVSKDVYLNSEYLKK
jgi:hypothetical protein